MKTNRLSAAFAAFLALAAASASEATFDWGSVTPTPDLHFHACYDNFQCARLTLPLDWLAGENGTDLDARTVAIAIIKLPAVVPQDDPSHAGTIFTQPGGPGGSGVAYLRGRHEALRGLVDIPGRKHYDLLAFDPRGVVNSTPHIECFTGLAAHMRAKEAQTGGPYDLSDASLAVKLAAAKADGEQCGRAHGDFLEFVGTANVARDMVAIVDELEELRARARASEAQQQGDEADDEDDDEDDKRLELRATAQKGSKETRELPRLNYIGISYGTLLGNYFASMFPGRVGRMVLDGVCDADEYAHEQVCLDTVPLAFFGVIFSLWQIRF